MIPGVEVRLRHLETGEVRTAVTSDEGRYLAAALAIGTYEISAELPGFKRYVERGIRLNVADHLKVDLVLQVGELTEQLTVESSAVRVQTETSELSEVITGEQITELAINGRNFVSLATLTTGVANLLPDEVGVGVTGGTGGVVINGTRGNYVNWMVDGAQNTDVGNQASLTTYPAVEALGEFRILTSNYSAEYGTAGSGIVAAATKAGGQTFHGSIYHFHRNDVLDAAPFFARVGADGKKQKSPLKLNNFGYTIGGPFYIPGVYNNDKTKDFFFWSQEWRICRRGQVIRAATPTEAMRRGDFTGEREIKDPLTGAPFPGNRIPENRINPQSRILLGFFPLPNVTTGEFLNFNLAPSVPQNFRQELVRWDHHFSDNVKLMGRFIYDSFDDTPPTTIWTNQAFPNINATINTPGLNYIIKLTHVMNPTLVHEFNFNHTGNNIDIVMNGQFQRPSELQIPQLFPENRENRIPNIIMGQGWGSLNTGSWPWKNPNDVLSWDDKWTWTRGNHSYKWGVLYQWQRKNQEAFGPTQGQFNFSGQFTGHAVADLLLGMASSYTELDIQRNGLYRYHQFETFFQDDWKVRPNFTINLGLRYFLIPHLFEKNNELTTFVPEKWSAARAPQLRPDNGAIIEGTGDLLNGVVQAGQEGVPRGLAKTSYTSFAPRVGFSWDPSNTGRFAIRGGYGVGYYREEGNDTYNFINNPPFAKQVSINNPLIDNLAAGGLAPLFPPGIARFDIDNYQPPQIHQWSFGIQQELFKDTLLEVGYVGSRTVHLARSRDFNQPLPTGQFDFDPAINEGAISTNVFRPFRGWSAITQRETSGLGEYHSLQVNFDKRFSEGLKFQAAYTFSKSMDMSASFGQFPQNSYNTFAEYSPSNWDVPHVLNINYIYLLPFFQTQEGLLGRILGGWQVSGITLFQSGTPSTIGLSVPKTGLATRPNGLGNPNDGPQTVRQWFHTNVFEQPAPGFFGNVGRNTVRGPGITKWDVSFYKNNRIAWFGGEEANLQFRAEFFNLPNDAIFSRIATGFGSGNFGAVTSTRDPRIIQLGIKIDY